MFSSMIFLQMRPFVFLQLVLTTEGHTALAFKFLWADVFGLDMSQEGIFAREDTGVRAFLPIASKSTRAITIKVFACQFHGYFRTKQIKGRNVQL